MIKITNSQAARTIGALLILLSGNVFAATTYATQSALNQEILDRKAADSTEKTRATGVEGTLNTAIVDESARATAVEGTLNTAIAAETARAQTAEATASGTAGAATGDMLYWDETEIKWMVIPAPTPLPIAPAKAILSFCNGKPTWAENCVPVNTHVYQIGDTGPAGGIVFHLSDNTGLNGLEAAPEDLIYSIWGCQGTDIIGTDSALGTGMKNTNLIVAGCADLNSAANRAKAYILSGYNDWYLPSKDELKLLQDQKFIIGNMRVDWTYWSSTQSYSQEAWVQSFATGLIYDEWKGEPYVLPVRAIRSFGISNN